MAYHPCIVARVFNNYSLDEAVSWEMVYICVLRLNMHSKRHNDVCGMSIETCWLSAVKG